MREVTKAEQAELDEVIAVRSLEMAEENLAKEYVVASEEDQDADAKSDAPLPQGDSEDSGEAAEPEEPQPSTLGSRGVELGGESEYFYSQFELTTRSRKIIQMVRCVSMSSCFSVSVPLFFCVSLSVCLSVHARPSMLLRVVLSLSICLLFISHAFYTYFL